MMYSYTLLVQMNQRVHNKLSMEHNISGHKLSMTHRVLKSQRSKMGIIKAPCLVCWALFGSLAPAMCHHKSFSQVLVHELPQSHCSDNQEGTLFSWLHIYYMNLASVRLEHSLCRGSFISNNLFSNQRIQDESNTNIKANASKKWKKLQHNHNNLEPLH